MTDQTITQKFCRYCQKMRPFKSFAPKSDCKGGRSGKCWKCREVKIEVTCGTCSAKWLKQAGSVRHWSGLCRKCSCIESASRPEQKAKRSEDARRQVLAQGGIPNAKHITKQHTMERHYQWKGGMPKCEDCPSLVSSRKTLRCMPCHIKHLLKLKSEKNSSKRVGNYRRGERHPLWKGGAQFHSKRRSGGAPYRRWRHAIFERDDYTCVLCNMSGVPLQADHIKPMLTHPELEFDVDNGRTLCAPCHRKTDTYGLKEEYRIRRSLLNVKGS